SKSAAGPPWPWTGTTARGRRARRNGRRRSLPRGTPALTSSSACCPRRRPPPWPGSSLPRGPPTRPPRSAWSPTSAACGAPASPTARASTPPRSGSTLARTAAFGYLKDLPELLHRIVRGGLSNKAERRTALLATGRRGPFGLGRYRDSLGRTRNFRKRRPRPKVDRAARVGTAAERLAAKLRHDRELSAAAAVSRRSKRVDTAATAIRRYRRDPTYRLLHDHTANLFASLLVEDMRKLANGDVRELSLAAKWCPSLGSSYDRSTLLCEAVARRLFPRGSSPELTDDLPDEHYAYRARERLRRTALVPLRRALQLPEVFMSARLGVRCVHARGLRRHEELPGRLPQARRRALQLLPCRRQVGQEADRCGRAAPSPDHRVPRRGRRRCRHRRGRHAVAAHGRRYARPRQAHQLHGRVRRVRQHVRPAHGRLRGARPPRVRAHGYPVARPRDHLQRAPGDPLDHRRHPLGEGGLHARHGVGHEHKLPGGVRQDPRGGRGRRPAAGEDGAAGVRVQRHGVRPGVGSSVGDRLRW
uniref:DUF2828 domain-containing protein n=1 Tax=Aegilops tauschii subsp. strangulata TaxID=200361 RepID=A0A453NIW8_AEGTS